MPSWVNKNFFRLFFATDVHGSDVTFSKFLNAASFYKADTLVLGGDVTGKLIVPILEAGDGTFKSYFLGQEITISGEAQMEDMLGRICNLGYYPYRSVKSQWSEIDADPFKYEALFKELALKRLDAWIALTQRRLKDSGISVFVTGGNDDAHYVEEYLKRQPFIVDPEGRVVEIGGLFKMVSIGYSNHTPWKTPRECEESELEKMIDDLAAQVPDMNTCIFNIHVPPINSTIDSAPMVDGSVSPPKYILRDGMPQMIGAGSSGVKSAIMKHQPMLGLHGHIHESRGAVKLGRTLCINPGSEYGEGVLRGVMVNLDAKGVKSYQLTSG